jgi:hypothetical protein
MGGDLRVPSVPRADFLWAGLGSLLVSSRVRATLLDAASGAIATTPARLTRVGRAEVAPQIDGDVPDSLLEQHGIEEPEDLVTKLAVHKPSVGIGPYFEVVVCRESERPPGAEVISRCSDCGREEFDRAKRKLVMHPGMWRETRSSCWPRLSGWWSLKICAWLFHLQLLGAGYIVPMGNSPIVWPLLISVSLPVGAVAFHARLWRARRTATTAV